MADLRLAARTIRATAPAEALVVTVFVLFTFAVAAIFAGV